MPHRYRVWTLLAWTAGLASACSSETSRELSGLSGGQGDGVDTSQVADCGLCDGICDVQDGICWPECVPGTTASCYTGDAATRDVGICRGGQWACDDDGRWSDICTGEITPSEESCDNGIDDDCDGTVDDTDRDGDGYGVCSGDCCDADGGACLQSHLVNAGAYEVDSNGVDDDCDGDVDEAAPTCDAGLATNSGSPLDYAFALDLCQTTQEEPTNPAQRAWGLIEAKLSLADSSGTPRPVQHAIRPRFGAALDARGGDNMVLLSSGHAAAPGDQAPTYEAFQPGADLGTQSSAPSDWLAKHGGQFPNPPACTPPSVGTANDPVMLTLRVRAPTNARSFSLQTAFFSAEYPEWVCSEYNDFFVALVDSTSADNPDDLNIAVYDDGVTSWPVGVNLVMVADGLFTQCQNGPVGCATDVVSDYAGCSSIEPLLGTGFDDEDDACSASQDIVGGGTGWLTMHGNVTPGEVFELRLAIWDTSGHIFDSLVLLDAWEWSVEAASPGVQPG